MKPTTEDFLIPIADVLSRVCPSGEPQPHHIAEAMVLRVKIAFEAKIAHDEECQRLADQWVNERIEKFNADMEAYRQNYEPAVSIIEQKNAKEQVAWKRGEMWKEMRDSCPSIFRDYISDHPPTA